MLKSKNNDYSVHLEWGIRYKVRIYLSYLK